MIRKKTNVPNIPIPSTSKSDNIFDIENQINNSQIDQKNPNPNSNNNVEIVNLDIDNSIDKQIETNDTNLETINNLLKEIELEKNDLEENYQKVFSAENANTWAENGINMSSKDKPITPVEYEGMLLENYSQMFPDQNIVESFKNNKEWQAEIQKYTNTYNEVFKSLSKTNQTEEEYVKTIESVNNDLDLLKTAAHTLNQEKQRLQVAQEEQKIINTKEFTDWSSKNLSFDQLEEKYNEYQEQYLRIYDIPDLANSLQENYNPMWFCEYAKEYAAKEGFDINDVIDKQITLPQDDFKKLYRQYEVMTPEEIKIYSFLFETKGREAAQKYLDQKEDELNQRIGYKLATAEIAQLSLDDEGKVKESLCDIFNVSTDGLADGMASFFAGIKNSVMNDKQISIDEYKIAYYLQYLQENTNYLDTVYQTGMATGNMLPSVTASFLTSLVAPELAPKVGQTLMGLSAYGNAKHQALINNYSTFTSVLYGLLSAGSEVLTEKMGGILGISDNPSKSFILNMLREGNEEFVQSYMMAGIDAIVLNKTINLDELTDEALQSFLTGALVAGNLNVYTTALGRGVNVILNGKQMKLSIQQITDIINKKQANPDEKISDILKLNKKENKNNNISKLEDSLKNMSIDEIKEYQKSITDLFQKALSQNDPNIDELEQTKNFVDNKVKQISSIENMSLSYILSHFSEFSSSFKDLCLKQITKVADKADSEFNTFKEIEKTLLNFNLPKELADNSSIKKMVNTYYKIKQQQNDILNNKKDVNPSLLELAKQNNTSVGNILLDQFFNNSKYATSNFSEFLDDLGIKVKSVNSHAESADYFGDEKEYLIALKNKYGVTDPKLSKEVVDLDANEMYEVLKPYMNEDEKNHYVALKGLGDVLNPNQDVSSLEKKAIYSYTKYLGLLINPLLCGKSLPKGLELNTIEAAQDYISNVLKVNDNPNALPSSEGDILSILDQYISSSPTSNAYEVTRGVDHIYADGVEIDPRTLDVGDVISTKGYSSSSLIPTQNYATSQNCDYMLQIIVPPYSDQARYVENLTGVTNYNQSEVLIARDAKMTVIDKSYTMNLNNKDIMVIKVLLN